jgi:hypothetical protein
VKWLEEIFVDKFGPSRGAAREESEKYRGDGKAMWVLEKREWTERYGKKRGVHIFEVLNKVVREREGDMPPATLDYLARG